MARYDSGRFEEAAKAYFEAYGEVPSRKDAAEQSGKVREMAGKLAKKLGKDHAATPGLTAVSTLRLSIARRFITISVAALAPAPAPTAKVKAEKEAPAEPKTPRASKARQTAEEPVAASA